MSGAEAEVILPDFRDVMRHLVHHAPALSAEMRDQYRDAIDKEFPEGSGGVEPARDGEAAPPGTPLELPPPPG